MSSTPGNRSSNRRHARSRRRTIVCNTLMTREQTVAFQARFRRLTERLHPELRFGQSATEENLWERVLEHFAAGEAAELEAIELIVDDLPPERPEQLPVEEIAERVARLKTANEAAINEISALRQEWPFPLAARLPDEEWVKSQREEYEQKTARLIEERDALAGELNRILDSRPSGK